MVQLFDRPDSIEVGEIQIEPQYQSRGIGTRILRDTIIRAHGEGKKVCLCTGLKNVASGRTPTSAWVFGT